MAKKTYKTYHLKSLQMLLFDEEGRAMEVNFKGGVQIDSTAKFSTSDETVQNALESCSGFNRDYYLESVREDNPAPAEETETKMEETEESDTENEETTDGNVVHVSTKGEAVDWLKEHHPEEGYTSVKLRSVNSVMEAGKKHGVTFVFD